MSVIFVSVEHKLPCNLPVQYNVVKSSQVYVRFGTSLYINNRQPYGSLSNVLRRPAVWWKGVGGDI